MKDTERAQGTVRLIIAGLAQLYVVVQYLRGRLSPNQAEMILLFISAFLVVAAILMCLIIRRPGVYPARRVYAMVQDYSGISFTMIVGGEYLLPAYCTLLWVTVGYGMRYGSRYLAVATSLALVGLAAMAYFTPYWREQPNVALTLALTTLIVPIYANILLQRSHAAYKEAAAATRTKSRFLAQASHDLRQPIHSISLFTACLRDTRLEPEARQMVDNIDKSLNSVSQLFRSILDSYTLESGNATPRPRTVSVAELLETLVQQNQELARWAGVTLRLRATRHHVITDADLLSTVVQNFISNAIKYGQNRPILIAARRRKGKLAIEVHDQGCGIPPEHLPHLCEEFYRVRQFRDKDVEGVGLGLSIAKRISEMMGLHILIKSQFQKGTVVAVEGLPIADRPATASAPPQEESSVSPLRGLRVLLIEDDQSALLATVVLLRKWGCLVETSTGLPPGEVDCDLILSDYDLGPDFSGADCIAHVRQAMGRKIPAVLITGHDKAAVQQAIGDSETPILTKPVRPAELRSMLASLHATVPARAPMRAS